MDLRTRPVTEEEADKLFCPFSFARAGGGCVGRNCMLWRWKNYGTTGDRVEPTGYCGAGVDTASQRKPAAAETKPTAGHTPGPWCFYADLPSTEPNWHVVTNASRMRVLANVHIEPGSSVDEANARLISAAPDHHAFASHVQWEVIMGALDKWSREGGSELVALGIIGSGLLKLDDLRRAALAKAEGR